MVFGLAMREIEADDVDAGPDQFFEDERIAGRGAEGGKYLGVASHVFPLWTAAESGGGAPLAHRIDPIKVGEA